ncbi:serine/threonine-protein kinase [Roseisolibacter agri]|uniref:non-specific serine/threonine protein kinase n=1 Tax=Roseisolibacter agri TaxID=2014610 RepID=A0AA37QE67_9BACT|nr:serine/threonine-protein kinase [Roseisolibacter agri]GLC25098.1 serine/threonine protein kinase [Roseisolibacter agri]
MTDLLRHRLQTSLGAAYTLERELGGGGMSRVFVAREEALGRDVVVKVLSPELAEGLSADRFAREIRLAAALQQANIVPVITAGTGDGVPYYTMPYVDGLSLRQRLARGPLPVDDAVSILRDVARALAYAHERGVVHRDIKPDNILLSGDAAVVTDFGIAKALSASKTRADGETLTRVGTSLGTPAYMAPEQAAGDPATDHRADLYALGCVAYELLTGAAPFAGRPAHALFAAHMSETPAPLPAGVPRPLAALVMRCLQKDPARRPQSARELLQALDATTTGAGRAAGRGWRLTAVAAVIALGGSAAVGARLYRTRAGSSPSADGRSLAVLPLANASGDTASAYFADGLTEELTSVVSKLPGVRVVGGLSAAAFRDRTSLDAREVGARLHVGQVLEGSVRRAGARVRIAARLTNTGDGTLAWSDTYERDAADVFAVQAEIARAVAAALRVRLGGADSVRLARGGTRDTVAHELYLRGRAKQLQYSAASLREAIALFEQAVARDPSYADAWAAIGVAWANLGDEHVAPREAGEHMIAAASRALAIDSTLGTARFDRALGLAYLRRISVRDLVAEVRRAVDASPNDAMLQALGGFLVLLEDRDAGVAIALRTRDIDPLAGVVAAFPAWVLRYAGRTADAERLARQAIALQGDVGISHGTLGTILLDLHREADALAAFERGRAVGDRDLSTAGMGVALARLGRIEEARRVRAQLEAEARTRYVVGDWMAKLCLALGDRDGALAWLARAADAGSAYTMFVDLDPDFAALRGDPRFEAVRRRVGLAGDAAGGAR